MTEVLLEVKELKKYFPVAQGMFYRRKGVIRAVDGVSFQVHRGETLGLVGESGCGKSTLSRVILQLFPRDAGEIRYRGRDVEELDRSQRSKLRMVFQNPYGSLNPKEKVFSAIAEPYRIAGGYSRQQIEEEVLHLLGLVGLSPAHARRYPHEFSGGQRQRIAIARVLALEPEFIICDEPVSALDVSIQAQILNLLKDIQEEFGLTYLFISHDLAVVKYICDRIAVMYLGKIMEIAPARALYAKPKHPYTRALLSAVPGAADQLSFERIVLEGDTPNAIDPPSGCRFRTRCPYAEEVCAHEEPDLTSCGTEHFSACHLLHKLAG
ncbi:MAG: ATP-binding cassette domain-containing protein [Bacillota bacterium]|nr:ATP-binding cassette domain-containing protein [Bacillota bacterium]